MFFLILICVLLTVFIALCIKYKNPYTLTFVFGKKGSGKSCLLTNELIHHKKKGWICYTDLPINIPGIYIINAQDLKDFRPEPHSFIALDEVGLTWDNRNFKAFDKGLTEFFKLQRKYKCKIIMNSQAFDVDKKIRDLTDRMILQRNIGNVISFSRPIRRSITLTEPSAEGDSRIADRLSWASFFSCKFYFMPRYFKYFNSFDRPDRPLIPSRLTLPESDPVDCEHGFLKFMRWIRH